MPRFFQVVLIASIFSLAWLLMQAVHEFGHAIAAWATGGTVERIVLHPLAISRTDVEPNPRPLLVAWAGPIAGSVIPLLLWAAIAGSRLSVAWLARFFAGFCLLSNGLYIGIGSFQKIGDAGDMQQYGSPIWTLWLFGLATAPLGLALWNGLGPNFGIGRDALPVSPRIAISCFVMQVVVALLECVVTTN